MAQVELLQRLHDEPGLRVNDLASRHRLASNTVSVLVQQLVVANLVVRTPDPVDRRAVRLRLTDQGRQVLGEWRQAHQRRLAGALDELAEADQAALQAALPALTRLVDRLEDAPGDGARQAGGDPADERPEAGSAAAG
jgi:DNA-binding MarR family transcriptional regulator